MIFLSWLTVAILNCRRFARTEQPIALWHDAGCQLPSDHQGPQDRPRRLLQSWSRSVIARIGLQTACSSRPFGPAKGKYLTRSFIGSGFARMESSGEPPSLPIRLWVSIRRSIPIEGPFQLKIHSNYGLPLGRAQGGVFPRTSRNVPQPARRTEAVLAGLPPNYCSIAASSGTSKISCHSWGTPRISGAQSKWIRSEEKRFQSWKKCRI